MVRQSWSTYTDQVIDELDSRLGKKYSVTVRGLLSNPGKYANAKDIDVTVGNMKEDVDKILDDLESGLKEEKSALNDALARAEAITGQLSQNISMQARQNRTPIIHPAGMSRDETRDIVLYINNLEDGVFPLIEKLTTSSKFIIDYTAPYNDHNVGAWLFSGDKDYFIRVFLPLNDAMTFADSRAEIDALFNSAIAELG